MLAVTFCENDFTNCSPILHCPICFFFVNFPNSLFFFFAKVLFSEDEHCFVQFKIDSSIGKVCGKRKLLPFDDGGDGDDGDDGGDGDDGDGVDGDDGGDGNGVFSESVFYIKVGFLKLIF